MQAAGIIEVDLGALARNYARIADTCAPAECGAVVKADAYGLGMLPVSARLHAAGCRHFFVATGAEGAALRAVLADARIFVFEGPLDGEEAEFRAASLTPILNTLEQIARWREGGGRAALHVDTGMNRLGLSGADVATLAAAPELLAGIEVEYLLTHFACADEPGHPLNAEQLARFEALERELPAARTSIGNSAAALRGADFVGDLARPGIALYGANPFVEGTSPVEPVVTLRARVLQLRTLDAASTVGYGASFAARPGTRIAVIGMGYADGYHRALGNRGHAVVGGQRVPIAGRISMDLMCLDVTAVPPDAVAEGDLVTLIGAGMPLEDVAAAAGTINYEILTSLGPRLERIYVEDH